MAHLADWTTQQWMTYSGWLANAYGVGLSLAHKTIQGQVWNTETLINASQTLGKGYDPGLWP